MERIEVNLPKGIMSKFSIGENFYTIKLLEGLSHQEREDDFIVFEHEYDKKLHTLNILFTARGDRWSEQKTYIYNPYRKWLYVKEGKEVIRTVVKEKMVEAIHPYFIQALDKLHTDAEEERKAEGKRMQEVEEDLKKYHYYEYTLMSSKTTKCTCGGMRYRVRTMFSYDTYPAYATADFGIFCPSCGCRYMREEITDNIRNTIEGYYAKYEKEIAEYEDTL